MKRFAIVILFFVCVLMGATIIQSMHPAQPARASLNMPILSSSKQTESQVKTGNTGPEPQMERSILPERSTAVKNLGTFDQPLLNEEDIKAILEDLLLRNQDFLSQPGWFHSEIASYSGFNQKQNHEYDGKSLSDLFSDRKTQSEWFHVNQDGTFLEYFFLTKNKDLKELQRVVIGPDGKGGNLSLLRKGIKEIGKDTSKTETTAPQPAKITSQIENILILLKEIQPAKHQMRGWQDQIDGKSVFLLEIEIQAKSPIQYPEYSEPSTGTTLKYVIDGDTGQLITSDSWVNLQNGEKVLQSAVKFDTAETVSDLPESIAKEYSRSLEELARYLEK